MADLKADQEACCAFKLPPSLDTLTHLAAVEGLALRDVITVALEIVIVRLFDDSPDLPSGLADKYDLKAATAPSFRAVLAAYRAGSAVQTADFSEVRVNSEVEVLDVGSSSLQFSEKKSSRSCFLSLFATKTHKACTSLLPLPGAVVGAGRSYQTAAGKAPCWAHWPYNLLSRGLCSSALTLDGYKPGGKG